MKRKVLLLLAIITTVSLSACSYTDDLTEGSKRPSDMSSSPATVETDNVATQKVAETSTLSSEQVKESSETESIVSKPTEPSVTEAQDEQTAVVSQTTVPESTETPRPSTQETKPEMPTTPPVSTEPEPTPIVSEPEPAPSAPPVAPEPQPTEPAFDVSRYVSYAKSYGAGIGLALDSSATGCWDTPIEAHTGCIYLERDIRDCLDWYAASSYTAFWVWSVDVGGGNYEIYIGYA